MANLFEFEEVITENHLSLAKKAWSAFTSASPESWAGLLKMDTSILPFLEAAITRLLEEYPSYRNGLSRTAQQALYIISQGESDPIRVFSLYQESEQRRFMGDSSFWLILNQLLDSSPALLKLNGAKQLTLPPAPEQQLMITSKGQEVLLGKTNFIDFEELERWIGGVHLTANNCWCWDSDSEVLINKINNCSVMK